MLPFTRVTVWRFIIIQIVIILGIATVYKFQYQQGFILNIYNSQASFPSSVETELDEDALATIEPTRQPILPDIYTLKDEDREYFTTMENGSKCFTAGTLLDKSGLNCSCLPDHYGTDCGIPKVVWLSVCETNVIKCSKLKMRTKPRRLIHGLNVNHETEFFEMRLEEIGSVVDVFIVGESNLTARGDPSPLFLLQKLQEGFVGKWHHKIVHVLLDLYSFPSEKFANGWMIDTYLRDNMGEKGLERIKGVRDDDLFLLLDADEIPNREVLLFLKLYDGYPEPISLTLSWSIYGFFWKRAMKGPRNVEEVTRIVAVSTMAMIREVYNGKVMALRRNQFESDNELRARRNKYISGGNRVAEFNIGKLPNAFAGWHCSWCYNPEGIRLKLTSAQNGDFPRWGDYKEKLDLDYIAGLIQTGHWFDGSKPFFLVEPKSEGDSLYAPDFVWKNKDRFDYLLNLPRKAA